MSSDGLTMASSSSASSPASSGVPQPLAVILDSNAEATSDFFPFHDVARLNTGNVNSDADDFSFRQLIEDGIDGGPEILLFSSGCLLQDGVTDCTRACNETISFFGSLETFYNCAALASISYWTRADTVYYISEEAERNASSIMGEGTLASFEDRPVLDMFVGCAQDACRNDGLAVPCDEAITSLSRVSTAREILDAMDNFCPAVEAEINPDIFGPGVLISYIFQVCFTILLYLGIKAFSIWVRFSQKQKRKPFTLSRIETMIWPDSSAMSRTSIAMATTLVEFQEAQAWFIFAVQIASILAIVVNSQEGTFWGEIIVNAAVAYHISQNGILPMFLIQICLHNEGIRNWHTFVGFLLEYLLAIIAATQKIMWKDAFALFKSQSDLPMCGGNPSPRTYCAAIGSLDGTQISFFPHPLLYKMVFLVIDALAVVILLVDQFSWTLRKHRRTKHARIGSYRAGRGPVGKYKKPWMLFKRWFWRILEVVYLVVNALYLVSLITVIDAESFAPERWSYGQIIAVTVWGPVIVKMIDLLFSGPPKNGTTMNSGPPRLRIDNYINLRMGTSLDEDDDFRDKVAERQAALSSPSPEAQVTEGLKVPPSGSEDAEQGEQQVARQDMATLRNRTGGKGDDDVT